MIAKDIKRIYLVRHGKSTANNDLEVYKSTPDFKIPLSKKGIEQARETGEFLKKEISSFTPKTTRFFYSPYKRTIQTTENILDVMGEEFTNKYISEMYENDLLAEQNWGDYSGMSRDEIIKISPIFKQYLENDGDYWAPIPNGENRNQVCRRVREIFRTIHAQHPRAGIENIVCISHGLTARAFIKEWLHLEWKNLENSINPTNCSVQLINGTSGQYKLEENIFVTTDNKRHKNQPIFPNKERRFAKYQNTPPYL